MMEFNDGTSKSFDNDAPKLLYKCGIRIPIVYTTKLDEMEIFKDNIIDIRIDSFINSLIKESKPKLNLKRKYSLSHSHNSYEDLSCHINTFNKKVARIAKHNNRLLSMCKPVKIVLEDNIKNIFLPSQSSESGHSIIVDKKRSDFKTLSTLIFDKQNKEADFYCLDKTFFITEYRKFRTDGNNDNILRPLKRNEHVSQVNCCCWYFREKYLKMLIYPLVTLRFMRKPHNCAINLCLCCCRKSTGNERKDVSPIRSSQKPSESPSMWFKNKMANMHNISLSISELSRNTLLSKSLRIAHKLPKKEDPVKEYDFAFLHSTNIDFGQEYYVIGANGQIKLHLKNTGIRRLNENNLPKPANTIVGKICCWYRREDFAGRLLALNALPNTVNYIRSTHRCSSTNCGCCCKPSNTKKTKLAVLQKLARHTNDLVSKKVNIKVKFLRDQMKPIEILKATAPTRSTLCNKDNIVSFNVSLTALENITLKGQNASCTRDDIDSLLPESATLDQKSAVRVLIDKTPRFKIPMYKTIIECSDLNDFTTKELRMLDVIFRAISKATEGSDETRKSGRSPIRRVKSSYSAIYPLLLNSQLCVTSDLRTKRFLPPLRAHLEKYSLPQMGSLSSWINGSKM